MVFKLKTQHITIETTNICDYHCVMCPQDCYMMKRETMSMKLWKRIIDDLATHGYEDKFIIDTQGFGDEFCDKLLFERLRYAKKQIPCVKFFTSSNCLRMNPELQPKICEYIDTLRTSFYATTPKTYELMHHKMTFPDFHQTFFEKVDANIRGLIRYKKAVNSEKPWIIGQMVIIPGINDHEVKQWKEYWEPKLDEIIMWKPHNFGGFKNYREIDHTKQVSCGRPTNGPAYVHVDGIVSMCCWDINENLVIGDYNTQTIEEIFHQQPYDIIRDKHDSRDFRGLYCWHCEQTTPDPECMVYTNKGRQLCVMTSDRLDFLERK